jgi:hypothetical protein
MNAWKHCIRWKVAAALHRVGAMDTSTMQDLEAFSLTLVQASGEARTGSNRDSATA